MYLSDLHIDGFGTFTDQNLAGLGPGLCVILGANESGKSTLAEFIRWILFGPGKKRPPEAVQGRRTGGRLRLVQENGRVVVVERMLGQPAPEVHLFDGLDRSSFERIFAVGLEELQGHGVLEDDDWQGRLHSASYGLGTLALATIRQKLEKEIRSSLTRRGTRAVVNQTRGHLQDLEEDLQRAHAATARYASLGAAKLALEVSETERGARLQVVAERLASYERLQLAAEPWKQWQEAEHQLETLIRTGSGGISVRERRAVSRFPEGAALSLVLLFTGVGCGLVALGLLPLLGASALALAGGVLGTGLYLLLHRGHLRMVRARQLQQLSREAQRHRSTFEALVGEDPTRQSRSSGFDPAALKAEITELRELQGQLDQESRLAQQRLGALESEMASIAEGKGPEALLLQREILERRLDQGVRRWATAALSLDILDTAVRSFTESRIPRILHRAGKLVSRMVGEELRLVAAAGEVPHLEASSLRLRGPAAWSSGLGDQTYLAMRLALAEELGRGEDPVPFVLDDVLIRLDPQRQMQTLRCLLDLSSNQQILLFTSRPSLVRDLKKLCAGNSLVNPSAQVVQLVQGVIAGPFEVQDCD